MVQNERQDELFDEAEDAQIGVAADLVESTLLLRGQEGKRLHPGQRLGQERLREVEALFYAAAPSALRVARRCERPGGGSGSEVAPRPA